MSRVGEEKTPVSATGCIVPLLTDWLVSSWETPLGDSRLHEAELSWSTDVLLDPVDKSQ